MQNEITKTISLIIPTLNEEKTIKANLVHLLSQPIPLEIIVVDGGSQDQTQSIVRSFPKVKWISTTLANRAKQMNCGAAHASGDYLLFQHADTIIPQAGLNSIQEVLSNEAILAGSFYIQFDNSHWIYNLLSKLSKINHRLTTYGDQGLFIRKKDFVALGGYPEIAICEDLEIQCSIRKLGQFKKVMIPVITSSRRFQQNGPLRQLGRNLWIISNCLWSKNYQKLKRWYPNSLDL